MFGAIPSSLGMQYIIDNDLKSIEIMESQENINPFSHSTILFTSSTDILYIILYLILGCKFY